MKICCRIYAAIRIVQHSNHTIKFSPFRSLRISNRHSDSACSSSAESSDCESTTHPQLTEAPVEILPGLFLGNATHSEDSTALKKYNIQYVLNVTPDLPNVFESTGGMRYLQIPITDHWTQDLSVHFPNAISFIGKFCRFITLGNFLSKILFFFFLHHFLDEARSNGASVLVHCLAGVSRSVTVTLAYLMHARSLCLNDAFALVRSRKPDVAPNFHFMEQLHSFEGQLMKTNPNRTPLSADSSYMTPDCEKCPRPTKYSCACLEVECQCMQTDFLTIGASPDSGIEFDRWPPNDGTPK